MAAHLIYADEMLSLAFGSPLWEPDCRPDEVDIGDVGYIRHGRFCRLFNATLPAGNPRNEFGVPAGYRRLSLDERAMVHRRLPAGVMMSRSIVKRGAEVELSGSLLEAGLGFGFACKKDRGAVLIINSEARRKDSEQRGAFKNYMLEHCHSWLSFANDEPQSRDIVLSDLVFVTGRDNTADWAMAAFAERMTSGGVFFEAGYPQLAGVKLSIWGSWKGIRGMYSNCGPQIEIWDPAKPICAAEMGSYNQCVFLRGFRVMDRKSHVLKAIKLKVPDQSGGLDLVSRPMWGSRSSTSLTGSSFTSSQGSSSSVSYSKQNTLADSQALEGSALGLEIISDEPDIISHAQYLLAYILENSDANLAIVHDDDISQIASSLADEEDSPDFLQSLSHVLPQIILDGDKVGTVSMEEKPTSHVTTTPPIEPRPVPTQVTKAPHIPPQRSTPQPGSTPRSYGKELLSSDFDPQMTPTSKPKNIPPEIADSPLPPHRRMSKNQSRASATQKVTKFDSSPYEQEQNQIKNEMNKAQVKLTEVKDKIALIVSGGAGAAKETALRAEIDTLRNEQINNRIIQSNTQAEAKRQQEEIEKKTKKLHASGKKIPAKSIAGLDTQIQELNRRIESGKLKIGDERKAVNSVSSLLRARAGVREYEALAMSLNEDRTRLAELQKTLDKPVPDFSEKIAQDREQLDGLRKQRNELNAQRDQIFAERDEIKQKLSELKSQLQESKQKMRTDQDAYYQNLAEERAIEAERQRMERQVEEEKRREANRSRILERARVPIFSAEKRDCQTLLDYFASKVGGYGMPTASSPASSLSQSPLTAKSESNHPGLGWIPMERKGEKEEAFFVGKSKKKRAATVPAAKSSKLSIPLGMTRLLAQFDIAQPGTTADVARTMDELHAKMKWLEENEARATEENVAQTLAFLERRPLRERAATPPSRVLLRMSTDATTPSTRAIELETLLRQSEAQNEQLVTEMRMLRGHLAKPPAASSTSEPVTLPPALLSLLLPYLAERGAESSSSDGSSSHSAAVALTQRAKLLQEENDELYGLLKSSETGGLMEEVRELRRAVRRMEGALQESHRMIHSLSTELDKCYETLSRPSDGYPPHQPRQPASRPIPTGPRKRARVSPSPQQAPRSLPGPGSPRPRLSKMDVDERSPDRYRRDRPRRRPSSKEGETTTTEGDRERTRERDREERDYGRRNGRDRDRRGGRGHERGLAERMGIS